VSFSNEGYLTPEALRAMLGERGPVREAELPHRRYIGSRIGIYNPQGEKVGVPGRTTNREHLFIVEMEPVTTAGSGTGRRLRHRRSDSGARR